jgi:hypothetical protein
MKRSLLLSSAALAIAILPLGAAQAQDAQNPFEGPYIGVHGGGFFGNVNVNGEEEVFGGPVSGFMGGFLAGINFPKSPNHNVMWGIEGDIGFGSVTGTGAQQQDDEVVQIIDDYGYKMTTDGHLLVRVMVPQGNMNFFGAAGLGVGNLQLEEGGEVMYRGTFVGPSIAAGIEGVLGRNLIGRVEGLYDFFGSKDVQYANQEWGTVRFGGATIRGALILRLPPN